MSIQIRVAGLVASAIVASAASAQTAVEWKVSDGGNGHWYQWVKRPDGIRWDSARVACEALGGHLATPTSASENQFLFNLTLPTSGWQNRFGPWLGGYQTIGSCEPGCGWRWVTNEPWQWAGWAGREPNNSGCTGPEDSLHFIDYAQVWNDLAGDSGFSNSCDSTNWSFLIEWDADCNRDGIVDYGQIIRGELEDLNGNGIPDICETSIVSVLPPSVPAQGGSTVTIRGSGFPPNPAVLIGGFPATNVVRESPTRLTAVTPAVLPGMKSVSVNSFTLPDAIYIRPECGSDLDQNGTVDAGDISIILLDFGPCYEPPPALAAPAPAPLLADEPAQKPTQR